MANEVLKTFRDGDDAKRLYVKGTDSYPRDEYTPTKERLAFLVDGGFIAEDQRSADSTPEADTPAEEVEEVIDASINVDEIESLDDLTVPQLQALLTEADVEFKKKDTKKELINKLRTAE